MRAILEGSRLRGCRLRWWGAERRAGELVDSVECLLIREYADWESKQRGRQDRREGARGEKWMYNKMG